MNGIILTKNKQWKDRDLTRDKTGKSNVIGERIDLISELILWCSKDEKYYNEVKEKKNINDVTKEEQERRDKAITLLQSLQDINSGSFLINAIMIILNLFPELKELFGSFINPTFYPDADDAILYTANNNFVMDLNKLEEEAGINQELNLPKLSSFTPSGNYLTEANAFTQLIMNEYDYKNVFNSNQYVFMPQNYSKNMFITKYNSNNQLEIYELIGIQMSNKEHAVCFVKTGKSDVSWSGIDSNREANDNNYALDDIINYGNTYLAGVYSDQNNHEDRRDPYKPKIVIYKQLSQDEVKNINKKFEKAINEQLSHFKKWSYNILKKEYTNDIINSDKNDNEIIDTFKQILAAVSSQENNKEIYYLLNDENYNNEVNNIIYNNICKIKQEEV